MIRLLFIALLLPAVASASPTIDGPSEVKAGGFARLTAAGQVVWAVAPEPVQIDKAGGVLTFTGKPGVAYTVTALVIDFDKKTVAELSKVVRFAGEADEAKPPNVAPPAVLPIAESDAARLARLRASLGGIAGYPDGRRATMTLGQYLDSGGRLDGLSGGLAADDVAFLNRVLPARGVPAAPNFPAYHAGHACPNCGATQYVVAGWNADGSHRHRCPRCSTEWSHR